NLVNLFRVFAIELHVPVKVNAVWAELRGCAQRHGGVHSEFASSIGGGSDHAPLILRATNDYRLAFERRIEQLFHGDEEGVHVEVEDDAIRCHTAISPRRQREANRMM